MRGEDLEADIAAHLATEDSRIAAEKLTKKQAAKQRKKLNGQKRDNRDRTDYMSTYNANKDKEDRTDYMSTYNANRDKEDRTDYMSRYNASRDKEDRTDYMSTYNANRKTDRAAYVSRQG